MNGYGREKVRFFEKSEEMKIVHISPSAPYNEGWGYQENLLPKYHRKLGNEVTLIITNRMHREGKVVEVSCDDYINDDGVRVIRIEKKRYFNRILTKLNSRLSVYNILNEIRPDYIFFHGLVSSTIYEVVKYKKEVLSNCIIVQDNHLDYNIGFNKKNLKYYIIRTFYRHIQKKTADSIYKVYGVTPWRKQYAEDFFAVSKDKTDILIMGADDDKLNLGDREKIRKTIREKYEISETDFLIVTGGKIDKNKNIDLLVDAVSSLENIKLIIFGEILEDVKEKIRSRILNNHNIIYIGWIEGSEVYKYFFAADLVCFPGQHSVLWEQACASKVPCIFKKWTGMEHVNNGGNSEFIETVTVESLRKRICELLFTKKYYEMLNIANSPNTDIYLYSNIARKSLMMIDNEE